MEKNKTLEYASNRRMENFEPIPLGTKVRWDDYCSSIGVDSIEGCVVGNLKNHTLCKFNDHNVGIPNGAFMCGRAVIVIKHV